MDATRRLWAVSGLAGFLALLAAILARPLPLFGTVLISAWLLSRQYLFYRVTTDLVDTISVQQTPAREWVRTDKTTAVTVTAAIAGPLNLACRIQPGLPPAATTATGASREITIDPGETTANTTVNVRWPVAGRHEFRQAQLTVDDGLFKQTVPVGETPTVTVEPRGPRDIHVGEGGSRTLLAYGEHDADHRGSGIEPAELREYTAGDTADRIDWNATARLNTTYVREYEAETDQQTLLFVDHRHTLATGPPMETKLAYLREVALAITDSANQLGDPLGLVSVGDDGITARFEPGTSPTHYGTIRRTLLNLEPTTDASAQRRSGQSDSGSRFGSGIALSEVSASQQTMQDVRQSITMLDEQTDQFNKTLHNFYSAQQYYQTQLEDRPLFNAVRSTLAQQSGQQLTVLCTDDSDPTALRETVTLATRNGGSVLLLLAPTVLYERGSVQEFENRYEAYVAFEEFRRELTQMDRVTALEVGPGDHLTAILTANQGGRTPQQAGGERP